MMKQNILLLILLISLSSVFGQNKDYEEYQKLEKQAKVLEKKRNVLAKNFEGHYCGTYAPEWAKYNNSNIFMPKTRQETKNQITYLESLKSSYLGANGAVSKIRSDEAKMKSVDDEIDVIEEKIFKYPYRNVDFPRGLTNPFCTNLIKDIDEKIGRLRDHLNALPKESTQEPISKNQTNSDGNVAEVASNSNNSNSNYNNQNSNSESDNINNNSIDDIYAQNRKKIQASNYAINAIYQGDFKTAAFSYASAGMATEAYASLGIDLASNAIGILKEDQADKIKTTGEYINKMLPYYFENNKRFIESIPLSYDINSKEYKDWISLDKEIRQMEDKLFDGFWYLKKKKIISKYPKERKAIYNYSKVRLALILEYRSNYLFHILAKGNITLNEIYKMRMMLRSVEDKYIAERLNGTQTVEHQAEGYINWTDKNTLINDLARIIQNEFNVRDLTIIQSIRNLDSESLFYLSAIYLNSELKENQVPITEIKNYINSSDNMVRDQLLGYSFNRFANFYSYDNQKERSEDKILFLIKDCELNYLRKKPLLNSEYFKDYKYYLNPPNESFYRLVKQFRYRDWLDQVEEYTESDLKKLKDSTGLSLRKLIKQNKDCLTPNCK